ncbi:DUF6287 domain-containing protein [Vagococcus hydrophili]|uniref:DUF6287 domain-containing protein n=1 Tax=Vagococcus hydrophili TaxID=2714947 RepID=A0A6G8ATR4_9ENTE|nr:DUF6287 domain-containing protein [Vagococcus hydrophili]QIL48359.1 hypothetical protein G7082_07555 [Vagococcus hydrophili]
MKNNKKFFYASFAMIALLSLSACETKDKKDTQTKVTTTETKGNKPTSETTSKKETKKSTDNSSEKLAMDISKIKTGDFSSIQGDWQEVIHGNNHKPGKDGVQYEMGGTNQLSITKDQITSIGLTVTGKTLTDNNGEHEITFKEKDNTLAASLVDQMVAINWSVMFYPKGTTTEFTTDEKYETNTQDVIVVWSSNLQSTSVFIKGDKKEEKKSSELKLDLAKLASNDLSSLVGTWKNPTKGETLVITDKIENKPADSKTTISSGAVVSGTEKNGYSTVISPGTIQGDYMIGSIGTFNPKIKMSPFAPIAIIPSGVKMSDADDSDSSKDRLIMGAGQSGVGTEAYYREK